MRPSPILFLFQLLHPVASHAIRAESQLCGINEQPPSTVSQQQIADYFDSQSSVQAPNAHVIPTVVFIIAEGPTEAEGYLPASRVESIIQDVNSNFAPYGFELDVQHTNYTISQELTSDGVSAEFQRDKVKLFRQGDYKTLNLFFIAGSSFAGFAGLGTFPKEGSGPITQAQIDIDSVLAAAIEGSATGYLTSGNLVTHEVGHWLGLYHVFTGGCADKDHCDDTTPQDFYSWGNFTDPLDPTRCVAPQSCGLENNYYNFMDYSYCSREFTLCQTERMRFQWENYRDGRALAAGVVTEPIGG